mmetsp:Transcript_21329/g.31698  ORF Transcript_21329/g.31698 Transcript_21329/m.31698 type:complete len:209 (-) Transcript_21329:406-1032(-)
MIPASASKMEERRSPSKSVDTKGSSLYPRNPFMSPSDLALTWAQISSYVVDFLSLHVKSTTDTSMVGTRKAIPVSFPTREGMTLVTALAAPVEDGMMFPDAARPPRQSFCEGPSTVCCVAVTAWMVVMRPSLIPNSSLTTLARGARQFVVQDALETTSMDGSYSSALTPITNIGASPDGAEMTTFLAPPSKCLPAFSKEVNTPVDSTT